MAEGKPYRIREPMFQVLCALLAAVVTVAYPVQSPRRNVSLVVTGGTVVTVDGTGRVLPSGAIAVDGRDIVAVDTSDVIAQRFTGTRTIDATGQVVLPGLINTHTHAPMVLYRGLA